MSTITIELPTLAQESLEAKWGELPRYLLEFLAVDGYRAAATSSREVGEMLGLDYWGAHTYLVKNKVYPQ